MSKGPAVLQRDRRSAAVPVSSLMLVGAVMVTVLGGIIPGFLGRSVIAITATYGLVVLLLAVGVACWRIPERFPDAFWNLVPVLAVAVIAGMNRVTEDDTVGAQLFFLWPCLYSAMFLRRRLVAGVAALVLPAEFMVMYPLVGQSEAISNAVQMTVAVAMASVIIVALRKRVDGLLDVLERQAFEDQLTGLPNRRAFDRDLARAAARASRTGGPLALLSIDVDRFKQINDTWGHPAGDAALQAVAGALRTVTRESDAVARVGGDEFVALLHCDVRGAQRVAGALRTAMAAVADLPGGPPELSIGVATMPGDADTVRGLLDASDAALYAVKSHRRAQAPPVAAPRPRPVRLRPGTRVRTVRLVHRRTALVPQR